MTFKMAVLLHPTSIAMVHCENPCLWSSKILPISKQKAFLPCHQEVMTGWMPDRNWPERQSFAQILPFKDYVLNILISWYTDCLIFKRVFSMKLPTVCFFVSRSCFFFAFWSSTYNLIMIHQWEMGILLCFLPVWKKFCSGVYTIFCIYLYYKKRKGIHIWNSFEGCMNSHLLLNAVHMAIVWCSRVFCQKHWYWCNFYRCILLPNQDSSVNSTL